MEIARASKPVVFLMVFDDMSGRSERDIHSQINVSKNWQSFSRRSSSFGPKFRNCITIRKDYKIQGATCYFMKYSIAQPVRITCLTFYNFTVRMELLAQPCSYNHRVYLSSRDCKF